MFIHIRYNSTELDEPLRPIVGVGNGKTSHMTSRQTASTREERGECLLSLDGPLEVLTPCQITQIDQALAELGPFSEVRLIKSRGRLRFIQKVESEELVPTL